MLQRQGLVCVCLYVCVKNIFPTAGSHSGQLQRSIWASTQLLVHVCECACFCACVCLFTEGLWRFRRSSGYSHLRM